MAGFDSRAGAWPSKSDPGTRHYVITPAPTDLAPWPLSVICLTAGNIVVEDEGGTQIAYPLAAGQVLPFRANKVLVIGTTNANGGNANGVSTTGTYAAIY